MFFTNLRTVSHDFADFIQAFTFGGEVAPERMPEVQTGPFNTCFLIGCTQFSRKIIRVPATSLGRSEEPDPWREVFPVLVQVAPQIATDRHGPVGSGFGDPLFAVKNFATYTDCSLIAGLPVEVRWH